MANQSGEFPIPGLGYRPVPQAVAYFDQKLWVIGLDGNGNMVQTTLTIERSGPNGTTTINLPDDAKSATNWATTLLAVPGTPGGRPLTEARCAATPLDDALYLFWSNVTIVMQFSGLRVTTTLMASRYTMTGETASTWSTAVTLQDVSGAPLQGTL